ncbi:MAG TPA: CaiB/BaiF CoA-transferase family protein [Burkholderiales bacterium]|jgi:crotonobetainyl-CoA:carnitine CoA-transferase CaiB-like acyl-CoA transferase|nr:CaiB/BaiF CoA-transferase family protein [Burkholderiales bacterium]
MTQPLAGIRVLELGNFIAGPLSGMLLADMGADVIKIEPPKGGDMMRASPPLVEGESLVFATINRNKRSIAVDLKKPGARELLLKLAAKADVWLENYRPGVLDKLGLGPDEVKKVNPKICYISVSGYGQTGPYRRRAAVNLIVEAASGVLSVNGEPGEIPMRPGLQTADVFGAMFATYAVLSSLLGAARHGEGRVADVSLVEASITASMFETAEVLNMGTVPQPIGRMHRLTAPYTIFRTRDDKYLATGASNNELLKKLLTALGIPQHLDDPRFATYSSRKIHEDAITGLVAAEIVKQDADALEELLNHAGVPCSMVNDYARVFDNPQAKARELVQEIDHPKIGKFRQSRNPILFDHDGPALKRPAPLLGEHTEAVLAEAGYGRAEIAALIESGAAAA